METAALIVQGRDEYTASEPVAGTLPLQRIIRTIKYAGIKRVVVAGEDYIMNDAFKQATRLEVEFIHTTRTKRKRASYLDNAVSYLREKCDRLLLTPAYYPLFDISTVKKMVEADAALAAPVYKGTRGFPMLLTAELFDTLVETEGDFDKLFDEAKWEKIEVDDEGVTADVTEEIDAQRIAATLSIHREVRPGFKLTLRKESSFYGPGIQEMIRLVEETGSLKQAYALMGMSSSYARHIIKETETGLGFKVFDNRDSKYDGSAVTEGAREYAKKYKAFHKDCENYIAESYKRHFE